MTLTEFRELTKDLPGEIELTVSFGDDDGYTFDSLPVAAMLGLDLVKTGEYDFIELFAETQEA